MTRALKSLAAVAVVVGLIVVVFAAVNRTGEPDASDDSDASSAPREERTVPPVPDDAPAEGMYVVSQVTDDGQVEVQTWVRAAEPVAELSLTTSDPDLAPGSVESLDLRVRTLGGKLLARRDSVGTNVQTIRFRAPASEFFFAYTIDGAMDDASASVEGRTLARVLGMDVEYAGAGGVVRRLVQAPGTVLNVACLRPTEDFAASPRPCGQATGDGDWLVDLEGADRDDRLLAQLEN